MPMLDLGDARDSIMGMLQTAWDASSGPDGYAGSWPPPLLFADNAGEPPENLPYATAELVHQRGSQVAIGDSGQRRFRAWGKLTVCIYTPLGDGLTLSDWIAKIVQNALETRPPIPDRVQFRNVRPFEDGRDGGNFKVRVMADVDYDRIH